MGSQTQRLLAPGLLPHTLLGGNPQVLSLPPVLSDSFQALVQSAADLVLLAAARDRKGGPIGGIDQLSTDTHFAQAFAGSAARAQLALLDPDAKLADAPNALLLRLAGARTVLADTPCGTGAAALGLLSSIAELRSQGVLPRIPLDIALLGADPSKYARAYAARMLDSIQPFLESQALFVQVEFLPWDVTDRLSNTDLIKRLTIAAADGSHSLLVVANVNGFLVKERKQAAASPQLEELFRHVSGPRGMAIWIEPDQNRATAEGGIFGWLLARLREWRWIRQPQDVASSSPVATASATFRLPLAPSSTVRVTLAIMPLDLERSK